MRVVSRTADGLTLALTTTVEALDGGCVVAQTLDGLAPTDPVAEFARAWMARALLGLKADVEGTARSRTSDPVSDEPVQAATASGFVGHGAATAGGLGVIPVHETASIEVAVAPGRLWELLAQPSSERLLKPSLERLVRTELADEPGREHVVAVHRHDDGRRACSVSLVVEASAPTRIVERDLTSSHEADVVTTIEPCEAGARPDRDLHRVAAGRAGARRRRFRDRRPHGDAARRRQEPRRGRRRAAARPSHGLPASRTGARSAA